MNGPGKWPESVGPYRIVRELGRGAMGVVFEAFDPAIGRTVALKVIRSQPLATAEEDAQLKLRFAREASAAGRLSHPNIVTIHQLGEHDGLQYLVMEYITGVSLDVMLAPAVPLDLDTALGILTQIAAALDYAHAEGVVHRDVKPSNILVKPDGTVKLTDFGIARIASQTVTRTGATMGTPAYMAPEQIMASRVDGRADQYSLAVVAYQMLTGQRPFEAPTDQALMFKIVSEEPRPIEEANAYLPRALAGAIRRGLSKDPSQRYRTCSELVAEMRNVAAPAPAEPPRFSVPAPPPARARRVRLWSVIAACTLLAAATAAWLGYRRANQDNAVLIPVTPRPTSSTPVPAPQQAPGQPAGTTRVNPKDGLKYVWIPSGTFTMGCSVGDTECRDNEKPAHEVTLTRGFWMGQTEVTLEAYQRAIGTTPRYFMGAKPAVGGVSWSAAQGYCQAVGMRLPTEAEWEYAARAGSTGSRYGVLDQIAWTFRTPKGTRKGGGQKQPNAWGLFDTLGGVFEWVADWYGEYPTGSQIDPVGPVSGQERVLRGGSFSTPLEFDRASYRDGCTPGISGGDFGLRCAGNSLPSNDPR
jgi:serine/threonine protein kinase